ncbi:MAG: DinB family protein [Actinomycetota bacterium]
MDATGRNALLEKYATGAAAFRDALAGITDDELDARPGPDEWTAREIVHHTADAEMRAAIRLRQLIAEDDPVIQGYDQDNYTRALHYDRAIETSLAAVEAARQTSAELLHLLTEDEWKRTGTHTESGPYGVTDWLAIYAAHAHDHADQIRRSRASAR